MKFPNKLPFLSERDGTLFFRRRVPEKHRARVGHREWKRALGHVGADWQRICLELRLLTDATNEAVVMMDRGQRVAANLLDDALSGLYPPQETKRSFTLDDAACDYITFLGLTELRKPEQTALNQFKAFTIKRALYEIDRGDVRQWMAWLRSERRQSPATIRRRLGSMRSMISHAIDCRDAETVNPFLRHKLPKDTADTERLPFNRSHLLLVDTWLRTGAEDRVTGLIIRLLRGTGARPLEIGGLDQRDIDLQAPIPFIYIRPNAQRGLKSRSSQRMIPLVGDALAAATTALNCRTTNALFPRTCHETGALSARLNKALRALGLPKSRQYTAYSFRHAVEDALRTTGASYEVQQAVMGHAPRSMTDRYGAKRVPLIRMADALRTTGPTLGVSCNEQNSTQAK